MKLGDLKSGDVYYCCSIINDHFEYCQIVVSDAVFLSGNFLYSSTPALQNRIIRLDRDFQRFIKLSPLIKEIVLRIFK